MIDILIGIIATIASTIIIGLFGLFTVTPYKRHQEIFVKILRFIRNYEDPRDYHSSLTPKLLMTDCIDKQTNNITEIIDLIDDQQELNPLLYKLFKYEKIRVNLILMFEYIRNPIMLKESKEFDDEYIIDAGKLFKDLKRISRFPWIKFSVIIFILLVLFISVLVLAFKLSIDHNLLC